MRFYNREREIRFLKKIREFNRKVFVVIYGRRRVGKTTLIKRVFGNDALYFFVEVKRSESLLREMSLRISKGIYTNWYDFFLDLFEKNKIVIFDEFQNFYKVNHGILYALQRAWDDVKSNPKLIVIGSYVGLIKKIFVDEKMPLFGRKDYLINLKPFSVKDSMNMLKEFGYTPIEMLEIYATVGGIPQYLWLFENRKPFEELIFNTFVDAFAPLRDEVKNILITEFGSEHRTYFSILEAIGGSSKTLSEISDLTGIDSHRLSKYVDELVNEYEILKFEEPLLTGKKRKKKYKIADRYYSFYFHTIYRKKNMVEYDPEKAVEEIYMAFPNYMGLAFEEICREYVSQNPEVAGFIPEVVGKSWGKIPGKKGLTFEIDIVAYDKENLLLGECEWENKKVGIETYLTLVETSKYLNTDGRNIRYIIFSKSGFSEELLSLRSDRLILLTPDDMI
ncbi:MAG: ATP-binding protein [Thermotoga sp.]|nr:MAG: ATP-binding protein [Thermotoga sp.]